MQSSKTEGLTNYEEILVDGIVTASDQSAAVPIKPSESKDEDVGVERMLFYAGDFGRYQVLLMVLFSLVNLLSAFHYFAQTFITIQPKDYSCAIPDGDSISSMSINESGANETSPPSEDKCKMYYLELTEVIAVDKNLSKSAWKLEDCENFNYDTHYGYESIVTELDWVCKDSWKPALGQSMYFVGAVVGTFALGIAADKWGRIKTLVIAYLLALIGNIMTVISSDLELFAASRLVAGLATDTNFVMMYIIVMEYIRPTMRTFGLNLCIGVFYCLGCSAVPWIAVALRTWRRFLVCGSIGMGIVPFYYLILPESASWLLTQGRADEALKGFLKIAKMNGKLIPDDVVARFKETHKDGEKPAQGSLGEIFKCPRLRRKMSVLIFKTMTLTLCYDAISRNVNVDGASPFVVFSLGSLTIFPACLVILIFQDRIGRKALFFIAVLSSAVFTSTSGLMSALIPKNADALFLHVSVCLSITARLFVVIAFNSGSQYAAELIPTIIRGRGVALIHVVGYAASFLSPLLLHLGRFWPPLPDLILGVLCFLCALATLLLPETMGKILPVTVQDGERFGEGEKLCEFVCCGGRNRRED